MNARTEADEWLTANSDSDNPEIQRAAQVVRAMLKEDEWLPLTDAQSGRVYEVWVGHAMQSVHVNGKWRRRDSHMVISPTHYREIRSDKPKGA